MTNKISIPKPCHENWDNMLPEEQGKHCMACSKTVIDFSDWNEDEILNYLQTKSNEKVCGRFNITQLEEREEKGYVLPIILKSNISILKKIAAIVLLCFGVMTSSESFGQEIMGKVRQEPQTVVPQKIVGKPLLIGADTTKPVTQPTVDTTKYVPQIMGMIKPYQPPKTTKPPKKNATPKK